MYRVLVKQPNGTWKEVEHSDSFSDAWAYARNVLKPQGKEVKITGPEGEWPVKTVKATNHMGEREYSNYAAWKRACQEAGADRFEGNKETANAFKGSKGVGEWDGEKGVVYGQKSLTYVGKSSTGGSVYAVKKRQSSSESGDTQYGVKWTVRGYEVLDVS